MRFLFVSDFEPERNSGAAGSNLVIADALTRLGHEVDLEWAQPRRVPHPAISRALELPWIQLRQVERRLMAATYDVVCISQPFGFRALEQLPRRHAGTTFLSRTHGWETRLIEAERRFAWGPTEGRVRRSLRWLSAAATARACARTARSAHGILTAATPCADYIRREYGVPASRIAVIPYGLDEAYLMAPERGEAAEAAPSRALFVGSWLPRKGTRILEEVLPTLARRVGGWKLTCVVDGGAVAEVRERLAAIGVERLDVRPWTSRERLQEIYREHDVFLYPSLFEGFGKTWIEAMACGACVVGFAEGGLPDVAQNGVDALYCPPGDVASFARALERALVSRRLAADIGRRGQRRVRELTWDRTARETVEFCERVRRERSA